MVTMEQAAVALRPELQEQVNFFADEDRQNFIDPITLSVIGSSLITLFLNAMVGEFGKTVGHELGTGIVALGHDAVAAIKSAMHGNKPAPDEGEQAVQAARAALAKVPPAQLDGLIAGVQAGLRSQLSSALPDAGAATLAAEIGKQAARLVHG